MLPQVFLFARCYGAPRFLDLTFRYTAIVVLSATLCPHLIGQTHGMRGSGTAGRINRMAPLRGNLPVVPGSSGVRFRSVGQRNVVVRRFSSHHGRRFNFFFANACLNKPFFDPFFCRQFLLRNSVFFAEPVYVPYPIYADASYEAPEESGPEQYQQSELTATINRLTDEVEQLREEQKSEKDQQQAPLEHKQAMELNPPTRILVFRDGHHGEITNYAVVGGTLWALTADYARKIPISDLDMSATKKANEDQGLEFP
jgi:hypothetical protein